MSCACTGACCAAFVYTSTPKELVERWDKWTPGVLTESETSHRRDDLYIADMLIEITLDEAILRADRFDIPTSPVGGEPHYTCRHWNEETRLCGAYEDRPKMCRDYPYEKPCTHGCGFEMDEETQAEWRGWRELAEKRRTEREAEASTAISGQADAQADATGLEPA